MRARYGGWPRFRNGREQGFVAISQGVKVCVSILGVYVTCITWAGLNAVLVNQLRCSS